jgi:aldehyde:ferredoxin oxidoreductase
VKGITVDTKKLGDNFCQSMGWDEETKIPTRESLEKLGEMKDVIQDLYGNPPAKP